MSILIDKLTDNIGEDPMSEHDGKWYIAKPLSYPSLFNRLKEAWKVVRGKAQTFHYKRDEK